MAVISRTWMELWPVAVLAVVAPAVPIGFNLARPPRALSAPVEGYPIRFALPPVQRLQGAPGIAGRAPALEFDLADAGAAGEGGSAVEVRKLVEFNGVDVGNATIRVGADSTLSISVGELRGLLARAGSGELARQIGAPDGAGGFIGFEEMRAQGMDARYDAAADRIVIGG